MLLLEKLKEENDFLLTWIMVKLIVVLSTPIYEMETLMKLAIDLQGHVCVWAGIEYVVLVWAWVWVKVKWCIRHSSYKLHLFLNWKSIQLFVQRFSAEDHHEHLSTVSVQGKHRYVLVQSSSPVHRWMGPGFLMFSCLFMLLYLALSPLRRSQSV